MSFKSISYQNRIIRLFQNAIITDRLAHAHIFVGQEGIGKTLFSKELAKAIFCQHPGADACDTCNNCKRMVTDNFPDLFIILPEENSRVIKIEQLKYLQDILNVKPLESKYKIIIIQSADRMNEEASNCLLKTLEEPPLYAIIILIATSLESIRATIRSRCQITRFPPLSITAVRDILVNNFQIDNIQAERLAFISNGSVERATTLSCSDAIKKKNWLVNRILELGINDNLTFSKDLLNEWHIQDLEVLEEKRSHVRELIFSFLMYYRDLLICKIGGSNLHIYHVDWRDALISKSQSLSEDVLFRILNVIKTSLEYLDYNANVNLLLENMITKILHIQFNNKPSSLQ